MTHKLLRTIHVYDFAAIKFCFKYISAKKKYVSADKKYVASEERWTFVSGFAAAVRQRRQGRSDFRFGNFTINQDVQLSTTAFKCFTVDGSNTNTKLNSNTNTDTTRKQIPRIRLYKALPCFTTLHSALQ